MPELFIHSRCCNAHWELVLRDGEYSLECEKCSKPAGPAIKIYGPTFDGCELCKEVGEKDGI